MKEYKIYVFRHGRTKYNQKGIFTGWKDPSLTWRGRFDARRLAKKLKDKKFEVAFYSGLKRSKESLDIVLKFHPECKKVLKDKRIIERSYGILEGTGHKDFIKKVGEQQVNLMIEGDAIEDLKPGLRKKLEKFLGEKEYNAIHRGYHVKVPSGESFFDVEKRVKDFIIYLKKFIKKNRINVAISAHGNSIRLFRKIMENMPQDEIIKVVIPYDQFYEYSVKV